MNNSENIPNHIDLIDQKILHLLSQNCELSPREISKSLGISSTGVYNRIRNLKEAGVIKSSLLINPDMIGYNVISFIGIILDQQKHYSNILESLEIIDKVLESHYTTGSYTIFLKVITRDNSHLMQALNQIKNLNGVSQTETFISLNQNINRSFKLEAF